MRTNFYASPNLRRIYKERIGKSMKQKQFAKRHKIGGQTMLSQVMSRKKSLPIDTAKKLAIALQCSIDDLCPEMADYIRDELLPVLGKGLRLAAALLLCIFIPSLFVPPDANAFNITRQPSAFIRQVPDLNTHWASRLRRWLERFLAPALHILTPFRTAR